MNNCCRCLKELGKYNYLRPEGQICKLCYEKEYRQNNRIRLAEYHRKYVSINRNRINLNTRELWHDPLSKRKQTQKEFKFKNKDIINTKNNIYIRERKKKDPLFNLTAKIRRLIAVSLKHKGFSKKTKTYKYLGCSHDELMIHLKNTFVSNYNREPLETDKIHIDHIKPCSSAETEEELAKLQHFTNLQWLLAVDNFKKSDRYDIN